MTGIERLRALAYKKNFLEPAEARELDAIADQIEREQGGRVSRMRVLSVVTEMERHVSGVEGMEDSPVARWARELREALGGDGRDPAADVSVSAYDLLPQEDREAIAWVREHGGLDAVRRRWECLSYYADPVPRSRMEKRLARLQRQIDESHAALRRRREIISELNHRACDLTRENAKRGETIRKLSDRAAQQSDEIRVMRDVIAETCARLGVEGTGSTVGDAQVIWREISRRLMPEGMEWLVEVWQRFEDGWPVRFLDDFERYGDENSVSVVTMYSDGSFALNFRAYSKGERVNRPAPKALDSEGIECNVGDAVWWVHNKTGNFRIIRIEQDGKCAIHDDDADEPCGMTVPSTELTHKRPVLDADGVEIREVDRVWSIQLDEPHEWIVIDPHGDRDDSQTVLVSIGDRTGRARPENLTHRAPVLAADGRPLREGETVYAKNYDYVKCAVLAIEWVVDGYLVEVENEGGHKFRQTPDEFTHERPVADTWERIEEDAGCTATKYNERRGTIFTTKQQVARDLVRRAKKLAGRDAS